MKIWNSIFPPDTKPQTVSGNPMENNYKTMTTILDDNFKIIVYRGGIELFPENSIEAIEESINENPHAVIEIDLQITKDNKIVAFHDFHLDDLTNGNGFVRNFNLSELQKLYLRNPDKSISEFKMETLENILDKFPNQCFVLDLHENNNMLLNKIIEIVEQKGNINKFAFVSILNEITKELKRLRPNWTIIASPKETKKFIFANFFNLHRFVLTSSQIMFLPAKLGRIKILNKKAIQELHRRNIKVWTCNNFKPYQNVNDKKELEIYKQIKADGIYTDNPKRLK